MIGGGLAGLTAAATAARSGRPVVLLEAHAGGGRARTDERSGYRFNQGPHALYRGGAAARVLRDLGVPYRGHQPPLRGAAGVRDGERVRLLSSATGSLVARLLATPPGKWAGRTAEEWAQSFGRNRQLVDLARMGTRVASYVADLERMPADLAIAQMRMAFTRGVSYLDGGWGTLVAGLSSAASASGATVRMHEVAKGVSPSPRGWEVALGSGDVQRASAVVIAAGGPTTARRLLPVDPGWPDLGPPVTAACLDLGLTGGRPALMFGLDDPLYLSRHCPPGDLAPAGGSVVHVMRYGARDAETDRNELRNCAGLAGITDDRIVEERFLAGMTVTHLLPSPEDGLAGRPGVSVPGADGVYLAGDWVGPTGWLADAALASGQEAGLRAAGAVASERAYLRVA